MSRKRMCLTTSDVDEGIKMKKKLDEKLASLCKKAHELSILCDVKVGIISSIPEKCDVFAWPSLTEAQKIVNDYIAFPTHKVTIHNNFLQQIVEKGEEEIRKVEETLEKMEMENLFNELLKGNKLFNEVNVGETKAWSFSFFDRSSFATLHGAGSKGMRNVVDSTKAAGILDIGENAN
ncbi:hypothetical protein RDI58_027497 [Solanum bulbocastanum]|uniref:MADS-box domain-containing protein n=1 Tax=Solanum bulbocastanum TaxID=147425 RepID=A0AAN8T3G7_SOLBU